MCPTTANGSQRYNAGASLQQLATSIKSPRWYISKKLREASIELRTLSEACQNRELQRQARV